MSDFREGMYGRYVTDFKGDGYQAEGFGKRFRNYCTENFVPLLDGLPKDARILDLGCGAGELLAALIESGYTNCSGIDISAEQVALAKEWKLPAEEADGIQYLDTNQDGFDAVFAVDFVEHFSKSELAEIGRKIFGALKSGGRLIVQTPNGKSSFALRNIYGDLTHLTIFSDESAVQWLKGCGFLDVSFREPKPSALNARDRIRICLRRLLLECLKVKLRIVTGRKERNVAENLILAARRD